MMSDPRYLDSAEGLPLEQHIARARQLQAETLRDGAKALYFNILLWVKSVEADARPKVDDEDFVCGHI